jgi:hypothetical protein
VRGESMTAITTSAGLSAGTKPMNDDMRSRAE